MIIAVLIGVLLNQSIASSFQYDGQKELEKASSKKQKISIRIVD